MNQNKIVGIGNIYACEALFDAGISPQRDAANISIHEAKKLTASIKKILTKAIKSGGSSLVNYKNVDGKMGYFQSKFSVYKREGEDCKICSKKDTKNSKIIRLKILGRSTYFCPTCQL
jgi:formamidopyrimidine-DNA glycosylase